MKVSASSCPQNINNNQNMGFHSNPPKVCYEPTSVLDLRRSPSPVAAAGKPVVSAPAEPLEWDDHVLHAFDWDSIMKELDFHDDSGGITNLKSTFAQFNNYNTITPSDHSHTQTVPNLSEFLEPLSQVIFDPNQLPQNSCFPDTYNYNDLVNSTPTLNLSTTHDHHNSYNYSFSFDAIQELIRAADCIDSNDLPLAHAILERLNPRLQSPIGKPLQRAAFFFKEALRNFLLSGSNRPTTRFSPWSEIVQIIRAYKLFSTISPIPMFAHFTINQALLDTLVEGSPLFIHVIDFDIGLGCHYASFMRELSEKAESYFNKLTSPFLRITAIVTEELAIETKLIKESLSLFANELKIRFQIDFVLTRTFELLSFKAVKFMEREKTAILLAPTVFRCLSNSTTNFTAFVKEVRALKPDIVVFVDNEGWSESGTTSFRRSFVKGLKFYSMMFESLDAAVAGEEWVKKIEMLLLKPRIFAAVEVSVRRAVMQPWREALVGCGFRAVGLSQFADFQADCLLRKVQVRGFYVANRGSELVLCWHQRPLIAISAWKC